MLSVIGRYIGREVVEVVVWVIFRDKTICLLLVALIVAFVLLIDLGFNIEELISRISTSSLARPTLHDYEQMFLRKELDIVIRR